MRTLIASICALVIGLPATASTLVDWGSETWDSATGMAWLDVSLTNGMSAADALAANSGYRLALQSEVMDLFVNADLAASNISSPALKSAADAFIALLGETANDGAGRHGVQGWSLGTGGVNVNDPFVFSDPTNGQVYVGLSPSGWRSQTFSISGVGTWLVRDNAVSPIPLPASVLLLGAGIGGLGSLRLLRKRT